MFVDELLHRNSKRTEKKGFLHIQPYNNDVTGLDITSSSRHRLRLTANASIADFGWFEVAVSP